MDIATLWIKYNNMMDPNNEHYMCFYHLLYDIITYLSEINDRLIALE